MRCAARIADMPTSLHASVGRLRLSEINCNLNYRLYFISFLIFVCCRKPRKDYSEYSATGTNSGMGGGGILSIVAV